MTTKTANEITCDFIASTAASLGLELAREDRSWTKFTDIKTGHKICVSLAKSDAPWVDTTVDVTAREGVAKRDGDQAPLNGKFVSLFAAEKGTIEAALKLMAQADCAPLRKTQRAAKKAPVAFRLADASEQGLHSLSGLEAE